MENVTWLQSLGACKGKPAGELQVGDVMGWNYGYTSTVSAILSQTVSTITVEETYQTPIYEKEERATRKFKKNRVVAIVENGKFQVVNMTQAEMSLRKKFNS